MDDNVRIIEDVDLKALQLELKLVLAKLNGMELAEPYGSSSQIGLQAPEKTDDWKKWWDQTAGKVSRVQGKERDDCIYPIFEELKVINSYLKKYNIFRARLMKLNPRTTLSWHRDFTPRIHIPIITSPGCFIVLKRKLYHLEAGKSYLVDTTLDHTAINCDKTDRWHLVGCVHSENTVV